MCSIVASRVGSCTRSTLGVRRSTFDVRREALLLPAGIKSDEKRWYRRAIRRAETIWERHLEPLEEHDG